METFEHTFTLSQSGAKNTSRKARDAYDQSLRESGFKPYADDGKGTKRWIAQGCRVGEFPDLNEANRAVTKAEEAAQAADPGRFYVEASNVTPYRPLRPIGTPVPAEKLREEAEFDRSLHKPTKARSLSESIINPLKMRRR